MSIGNTMIHTRRAINMNMIPLNVYLKRIRIRYYTWSSVQKNQSMLRSIANRAQQNPQTD